MRNISLRISTSLRRNQRNWRDIASRWPIHLGGIFTSLANPRVKVHWSQYLTHVPLLMKLSWWKGRWIKRSKFHHPLDSSLLLDWVTDSKRDDSVKFSCPFEIPFFKANWTFPSVARCCHLSTPSFHVIFMPNKLSGLIRVTQQCK